MKKLFVLFLLLGLFVQQFVFAQTSKADKKAERWVENMLRSLSLREKIGQMVMVRMSGEFTNLNSEKFAESRRQVEENRLGGFIVFRGEANSIAALTNEMQRISKLPLLFAADYERGLRMQLRTGTPFTTNMGVGATGDVLAAYRQGKIIAEEMRAIGVNWLFAPVADINNNPDNPVINIRSFGANPEKVGEFAAALAKGVRDGGALATLKHFPGHGDTATDSHIGLAKISANKTQLEAVELVPFKTAIGDGVDAVMTAHLAVPQVTGDDVPATLNPKISNDILRKELGFKGIITTDAMEMGAIKKNYSDEKSVVMAVLAGADIVLLPADAKKTIDAIEAAVKSGELTEARIDESVRRLLSAKYRLGLTENRLVDLAKVNQVVEKSENVREANATAEKSITLLRNADNILPMTAEKANKTLFVVIAADDDPIEGIALIPEIMRRAPKAKIIRLDLRSTKDEYEKVLEQAKQFDSIILAPFVKRAALKGTVALPENQTKFVREMIDLKKPVAVVAFGSPYLIRQFPEVKTYVVTYAIEEVAQTAAVRTMFGEVPFTGKLPVSVPGIFEIGAGISR
ncbi:MAG: glycoside hydrolase family 3 C-terminal domain-containing protein [Acidobacteria bacterium]|nr:glycoside hydrolase family 3 C-terminal domain-containing protein [Acidobacteriota bacterium]MBA3785588.1 glycoside hydrolase family 3 C-terminal domain-containing protein [Acidobacteriota bacterium]MBA4123108.1 glycoside hydrolase family 3 C-terminal domain-containing protein [Acidobacteriota bacterium]MBA4182544.1 glycoside hydrolase family 3 C-terminal domain-containing protein [Acidobacteriota bacterium]